MTDPTPRDTRLFDAGAHWATEPTDRRGYGDALRDAVERATTPGDRDRGREPAERDDERRWDIGNALGWELEDESPSWAEIMRGIADLRALATSAETEVRRVLADRGYRADDEPVHVLLGRVLDWLGARSTDPYGTGDGSYPTLAGGSS